MTDINHAIAVVNVGLERFRDDLESLGVPVAHVDWRPPAGGDLDVIRILTRMERPEVEAANIKTISRMRDSHPLWIDVDRAIDAIPGMEPNYILHSGPPIEFEAMCDPQQRAVEGAAVFEGWVTTREELLRKVARGEIVLKPNYSLGSVGAMCGIISPSMAVIVTEDQTYRKKSWATFNEGTGNVLWMGMYDDCTIKRLRWMSDVMAPALKQALRGIPDGGIDIFRIIKQGLQMGDEVHARSAACTMLLQQQLTPAILEAGVESRQALDIHRFMTRNNHFFLSLTLTACKVAAEGAHGIPHATVVTAMSRNGVDFAVRLGGCDEWFNGPTAPMNEAIYYSGYTAADAAGDIGDSGIVETVGLGGMIIGAAPSISSFVGGSMNHCREAMAAMRSICSGENPMFSSGSVDFTPAPVGIDARKVVRLGISPIIDTGVIHKSSGVGQIGTGIARAPLAVFEMALRRMDQIDSAQVAHRRRSSFPGDLWTLAITQIGCLPIGHLFWSGFGHRF